MRMSPSLQISFPTVEERFAPRREGGSLPPGRGRVGSGGRLGGGRLAVPTDLPDLQKPGDRRLAGIATLPVSPRAPLGGLRHPPRVYRHPGRRSSPPYPRVPPPRSAVVATLPVDTVTQVGSRRHPTRGHRHPGRQSSPPYPRTPPPRSVVLATLPVSTATQVGGPRRQDAARRQAAVWSGEVLLQRSAPLLASPLTQPSPSQGGGTLRLRVNVDPVVELPGVAR